MRLGRISISPRESSCHTRSATSASTSPAPDHLAHQRHRLGRDGEVVEARREARQPQDAHRVFGKGRRHMAQHPPASRSRWPPCGSISVPSSSRAMALIVRSRRARSSSSVTSGAAWKAKPW
jgi:hypothetical protein